MEKEINDRLTSMVFMRVIYILKLFNFLLPLCFFLGLAFWYLVIIYLAVLHRASASMMFTYEGGSSLSSCAQCIIHNKAGYHTEYTVVH